MLKCIVSSVSHSIIETLCASIHRSLHQAYTPRHRLHVSLDVQAYTENELQGQLYNIVAGLIVEP